MQKVAVMGAGAIGCYYGGMLARAGCEVTLVGRRQHVEAIRRSGLRIQTNAFDESVAVRAAEDASGLKGAELVLFSVKSPDTERTGAEMAAHLERNAAIVTLQNGVDNAERLAAVLKREVIPAVVYVATEMAGPGHVRHHGRGELVIGPSDKSTDIQATFAKAGVPVEISDNVIGVLWGKLVVNCAYNALSAIAQLPYGILVKGQGIPEVQDQVVNECLAVARASGITIPGDLHVGVHKLAQTMAGQYSSTAQDLARGKPTEIDHLNGVVVRKGAALGIPTPANAVLLALVKLLEKKAREN